MTTTYVLGVVGSMVVLATLVELLRRRHLREKHAVLWIVIAVGVVLIALFPGILVWLSELAGVAIPSNLLFFVGTLVLLVVTLQHSYEVGRLEDRTRTLAEELALLQMRLDEIAPEPTGYDDEPTDRPEDDPVALD